MNTNNPVDDKLFYLYGVKPLEKEFANFDKKICDYLMREQGFTKAEAFQAWQLYKINVKLLQLLNPIMFVNVEKGEIEFPLGSGSVQLMDNTPK